MLQYLHVCLGFTSQEQSPEIIFAAQAERVRWRFHIGGLMSNEFTGHQYPIIFGIIKPHKNNRPKNVWEFEQMQKENTSFFFGFSYWQRPNLDYEVAY